MAVDVEFLNGNNVNNINNNFQRVKNALQEVVGRNGNLPNHMNADLDMNSNDILNAGKVDADSIVIQGLPLGQFNGTFKGEWSSSTTYLINDVVRDSSGNLWIANRTNTNVPPSESADWSLFMPGSTVADNSITTEKLVDGAVTVEKTDGSFGWAEFDTKAEAEAYSPDSPPDSIYLRGYSVVGEASSAIYKKVLVEPTHAGKFSITLSDTITVVWYELAEEIISPSHFGGTVEWYENGNAGEKTAYQNALASANALSKQYSPIPARVYTPPSVLDFGARPDWKEGVGQPFDPSSTTDNSAAFQDALDYVAANGGVLNIPGAGTLQNYWVQSALTYPATGKPIRIQGEGSLLSRIVGVRSVPGPFLFYGNSTPGNPAQRVELRDFMVWGDTNVTYAVEAYEADFSASGLYLWGLNAGLRLDRCYAAHVTDNWLRDLTFRGIFALGNTGNGLVVERNKFNNCGTPGNALTGAICVVGGDNPSFVRNDIEGCNTDFILQDLKTFTISENYCEGGDYHFAFLPPSLPGQYLCHGTIMGNWFNQKNFSSSFENTKGVLLDGNYLRLSNFVAGTAIDLEVGYNRLDTSTVPASTFTAATLNTGFFNHTGIAGYRKGRDGRIYLRGLITKPADGVAFTLPVGYRPDVEQTFGAAGNVYSTVNVKTNGQVALYSTGTLVGISGISFAAA